MNQADLIKAVASSSGLTQSQVEDALKGLGIEVDGLTEITMEFQSNALWPDGVCNTAYGDNISTDTHPDRESAVAACMLLKLKGFGGNRTHFPLITWVSEVEQPPRIPDHSWNYSDYRYELKISPGGAEGKFIYHHDRGILSFGSRFNGDCTGHNVYYTPVLFKSHEAAQKWIESGTIAEIQEISCVLDVCFTKNIFKRVPA